MSTRIRGIWTGVAILIVCQASLRAEDRPYYAYLGEAPELSGIVMTPFYAAADHDMLLWAGENDSPYTEPNYPDWSGMLLLPGRNPDENMTVTPIVAVNSRGIAEGLVLVGASKMDMTERVVPLDMRRMRVKGRIRSQSSMCETADSLENWLRWDAESVVGVVDRWNLRMALQGRGGAVRPDDPSLAAVYGDLLGPEMINSLEVIETAGHRDRFRFSGVTSNQVTYRETYGPFDNHTKSDEVPRRPGNRAFQPTGKLSLVYDGLLESAEAGMDVRMMPLARVAMFYSSERFDVSRAPTPTSARLVAKTDALVDYWRPTYDGESLSEYDGGKGMLNVTAAMERSGLWRPGRMATSHQVRGDRGVVYRRQSGSLILSDSEGLISHYEYSYAGKPAYFLDPRYLQRVPMREMTSGAQARDRWQMRFLGPQDLPLVK